MKKLLLLLLVSILTFGVHAQLLGADGNPLEITRDNVRDHYRRSSLCIVLLVHTDKKYADGMTRVFQDFPMPARYNEHNVDVRCVAVKGKQSKADIDRILRQNNIAQSVVSRWFNRSPYTGMMNMDLVHDRGGYGAFRDDYDRVSGTVRGTAALREEGIELLENTFVLVCDMDYIDKSKGFKIGSVIAAVGSVAMAGLEAYSQVQATNAYYSGDYSKARSASNAAAAWGAGKQLAGAASAVLADLGGFRVKIQSYLYQLRWDQNTTNFLYNNYWVDANTPRGEAQRRKDAFDNARFGLDYLGDYKAASGKTILKSWSNEDEVILDVCERAVGKAITTLAKKFEVFRPRTPFYAQNGLLYSHIGTKEDVERGKKYEVVQKVQGKNGKTSYKRLGVLEARSPWSNKNVRFDDYFDDGNAGTAFEVKKGKYQDFAMAAGLQIREMK